MSDPLEPPEHATDDELLDWIREHEKPLFERGILKAVSPYLGGVAREEVVDGTNPNFPGLTFDFAVHLRNGRRLAVEIGRVVLPVNMKAGGDAAKFSRAVEGKLDEWGISGVWVFMFRAPPDIRTLDMEQWLRVMQALPKGERTTLNDCDIQRQYMDTIPRTTQQIIASTGYDYRAAEPTMKTRFGDALDSNESKLMAAANVGFDETHLIVAHDFPGSTTSWPDEIAARASQSHPQFVWAVAFRADVTRLKPVGAGNAFGIFGEHRRGRRRGVGCKSWRVEADGFVLGWPLSEWFRLLGGTR